MCWILDVSAHVRASKLERIACFTFLGRKGQYIKESLLFKATSESNFRKKQWRREGGEGGQPPRGHVAGGGIGGGKFGILAFALQCVSLYLFFKIYSVH